MNTRYYQVATATIANGASVSSAINVTGFKNIAIEIPTAAVGLETSTVSVYISGSDTSTGTFRQISNDDTINLTSASAGNYLATTNNLCPDYIKVVLANNTATAAGYACKVHMYY